MSADLEAEFDHCLDPVIDDPAVTTRLLEMGVPSRVIFGLRSVVGVARIEPNTTGFFELCDSGAEAFKYLVKLAAKAAITYFTFGAAGF